MSRSEKIAFALSAGTRNKVLTDEVKAEIEGMLNKGMVCKDIVKALKVNYPNVQYPNVRLYLQRQADKEAAKETAKQ